MSATATADVIVIGLGAMGSSTCLQLAERGMSVIGIDRYAPPHEFGSTHGDTRITRLALGEGAEYVPLVLRSNELWRELEARAGVELLTHCGGLILGSSGASFLNDTRAVAQRCGIAHEYLGAEEIAARFPMFAVGAGTEAYYEPAAGYLRPEVAVSAQLGLAAATGATLRFGERVLSWSASDTGVSVSTDAGGYVAEQLVLSVGPWLLELFPEGRGLFAVHPQIVYWFEIERGYEQLREMPVFVWDFGPERDGFVHIHGIYGLPALDGPSGGLKVGTETYERTTTPDGRQHPATAAEAEAMYGMIADRLPWLGPRAVRTVSCLYTNTLGSRFLIDRHPDHERVLIVSPCSGHGFKHSPAIGEAVAQLVATGSSEIGLGSFAFEPAV